MGGVQGKAGCPCVGLYCPVCLGGGGGVEDGCLVLKENAHGNVSLPASVRAGTCPSQAVSVDR